MSSFHKPKLYRTLEGCCICKAKSSSSRFTSSAKYEDHFRRCFQLREARRGEICNACVLLVKRFRKLPLSSPRHWGHVVDARAGPGVKNFVRERRRESCRERCFKKKHVYRRKPRPGHVPGPSSDPELDSDVDTAAPATRGAGAGPSPGPPRPAEAAAREPEPRVSDFIDLSIWKKTRICCGTIFVGPGGEAILDPRFLVRCPAHSPAPAPPVPLPKIDSPLFTIEKIIESELKTLSQPGPAPAPASPAPSTSASSSASAEGKEEEVKVAVPDPKVARSPTGQSDTDTADEGFYDKPSISPTNSID